MTGLVPTRRAFPPPAVSVLPRRRGMGGLLSAITAGSPINEAPEAVTGQPWWIPDAFYNFQGQASPDQVYAANQAANKAAAAAAVNPVTGQPVPAAVAYADQTAGVVGQVLQQGQAQPTGSPIADTFSTLLSGFIGTGTNTGANPSGTPTWEILLALAALGVGGVVLYKTLFK